MKDILPISIEVTTENDSTLSLWYLGVNDTYKTELNIGGCGVHGYNDSTKIWRNYLDSFTINSMDFDSEPIISHK